MAFLMCNEDLTINLRNKKINQIRIFRMEDAEHEACLKLDYTVVFEGTYEQCVQAHHAILDLLEDEVEVRIFKMEELISAF